jgi:hypothetical protein
MNEDDLTKVKSKKAKVKKGTEKSTEKVQIKAEKKTRKKVEAKAEAKTKNKKSSAKAKSVKPDSEVKAEPLTAKIAEIIEVKAETAEPKTKETAENKIPAKTVKPRAKKAAAEILKENEETEILSLPLAAKIQTTQNLDSVEKEAEAEELSPVFKELAEPKLPSLREENRAFLQMQSPTRLFFYWSLKQSSYNTLRKALGNLANDYFLAIRLTNLNTNKEEIHQVGNKGSWWFNQIEADSKYRAEVGFYAQGRPFVRIVFSNTLETPRLKPSANTDYQPYFAVTADQFAEVLDLAGYTEDAFEVYLQGDEPQIADEATQKAFVQLSGETQVDFSSVNVSELRYVLFALASGVSLFALRGQVSSNLFEFLATLTEQNPDALTEEKVILALEEFFGFSPFEESIKEEFGAPTVFGASLINFPKQFKKKTSNYNPKEKLNPLSSFSLK